MQLAHSCGGTVPGHPAQDRGDGAPVRGAASLDRLPDSWAAEGGYRPGTFVEAISCKGPSAMKARCIGDGVRGRNTCAGPRS